MFCKIIEDFIKNIWKKFVKDLLKKTFAEPSNCKILPASLPNVIIEPSPTSDGYKNGTIINLKCEPDYEAVFGSEPTRTCLNGQISPSLITSTFECSKC